MSDQRRVKSSERHQTKGEKLPGSLGMAKRNGVSQGDLWHYEAEQAFRLISDLRNMLDALRRTLSRNPG
jgi:hypothetical protein